MKWTLFLFDEKAERYCPGYNLIRFYKKGGNVILEFEDDEAKSFSVLTIKCSNGGARDVYDKVCESMMGHPGVIDLRDTYADGIEEE